MLGIKKKWISFVLLSFFSYLCSILVRCLEERREVLNQNSNMLTSLLSIVTLVVNELMAANVGEAMSPAINFDSWIELYNPSDNPIDLGGMYLSNDADDPTLWQMPADMGVVPAGGFKVVWLGSSDIRSTQAPFKLDCSGGTILLTDGRGQLVFSQDYPEAISHTAYARTTDGGDEWGWTATPTPEASNAAATFANRRLDAPVVSVGSRLFTGTLQVSVAIPEGATLMYTTDGSLPSAPTGDEDEPASPWHNWVKNSDCEGDDVTCLVGKDGDAGGVLHTTIEAGAGWDGTRGIKVHSVANASEDWTTQFFVYTPDHIWNAGDTYRFCMKVRADKPSKISVQSHKTPGSYIHWQMLDGNYNVTTEWQEIVYEGTVTSEQAGSTGGGWWGEPSPSTLQTIAFNLNINREENNFYFDDITWESFQGEGETTESSKRSSDGLFSFSATTNLRVRLFQDGYLPSVPVTRSYIKTSNEYTFPVVSIVGDQRYFTDPKIGIDCNGDGTNGITGNGQNVPRNYNRPWDRPVNFSFIGTDGEMLFNQDVNISVSGGWTRSMSERSFKLKSNKVFDGQNHLDFSFFPQKPFIRSKAVLVRNGGNDVWEHNARFMDPALQTIIQRSGIDVDVQSYVPVVEYVNGQCRGILNLREPNNDKYVYANWGYDDEEIDMFENFQFNQGNSDVLNRIYELGTHINDAGAYDELKTLLDIDEFTNYMAVELFLGNDDWPDNNIKGYRSQDDGRYRFICFDLDYSFALRYDTANDNPFTFFATFSNMKFVTFFLNLLDNDAYRRQFIDTYCLVAGSVFEKTRALNIVNELANRLRPMLAMTGDNHSPDRCINTISNKLNNRLTRMMTCLQQFKPMKLTGTKKQTVKLKADTEDARLYVNGLEVPYADFDGILFGPVTLEAKAPADYRFTGWKSGSTLLSEEPVIQLPTAGSVDLTATFTPLTDEELTAAGIPPVRINEVSAANGIYVNEYFKRNDWVELYNTTWDPIDVEGMYLSDNLNKPTKYQISKGDSQASTVIPAHGYLVVWCDKLDQLSQLHASFKLAAEGGDVLLTAADESWTDRLTYTEMKGDETAGRYPDGCGEVITMNVPSIAKANHTSSYAVTVGQAEPSAVHDIIADTGMTIRYAVGALTIRQSASADLHIDIVNMAGQLTASFSISTEGGYALVPLTGVPGGVYIATVTDRNGRKETCKFAKQ